MRGERDFFFGCPPRSNGHADAADSSPNERPADDAEQEEQGGFASGVPAIATAPLPGRLPLRETAAGLVRSARPPPGFDPVAAEQHGRSLGTNFLDEGSTIARMGPITIDPLAQDSGVGTLLMLDVIERARCTGVAAAMLGPVCGRSSSPVTSGEGVERRRPSGCGTPINERA